MTHALKRRAGLLVALMAILSGLFVSLTPSPAKADVLGCDYAWGSLTWQSASWGRAKLCEVDGLSGDGQTNGGVWFKVQTEDTLTDGWCVKVQYRRADNWWWYDVPGSTSCGGVVTSQAADGFPDFGLNAIRLVRGQCTAPYEPGVCVNYKTLVDQL